MKEDSELLLDYARRGDVESLSALVRRHTVWMTALLRGMLSSRADVEDAFQEAWVRIIKSAGRYRGGSVRGYLASAARSAALDRLRRAGRTISLDTLIGVDDEAPPVVEIPDAGPSPGERVEAAATAEDVRRAMRVLPEGPRQVLLLRIEGELTFKEISEELDVPLGTALTWMRVATVTLKRILGGGK